MPKDSRPLQGNQDLTRARCTTITLSDITLSALQTFDRFYAWLQPLPHISVS